MRKSVFTDYLQNKHGAAIAASLTVMFSLGSYASAQIQTAATRHTRDAVTQGQAAFVQHLDSSRSLHLVLGLPLRDERGAKAFIENVYNPASPNYQHYLTGNQFTIMFGPSHS